MATYIKRFGGLATAASMVAFLMATSAQAATAVVVTPANTQGWSTADTRPGGAVHFILDATAPAGKGALQLTTDATTAAKAQYLHSANTPLSSVTDLSYYTKQVSALFAGGDASYQLPVLLNGTTGFTTLVYEPYENGTVIQGVWQLWNVSAGHFWSTRTVTCSNGGVVAGGGGAPFYTLAQLKSMCPNAVAIGFGVNIGTYNPGYNVETDLFNFNGTVYNFEVTNEPTDKDQCKKGGYVNYTDASGQAFPNQGQCVSFVETQKDKKDDQGDKGNTDSSHGDHGGNDGQGQNEND